MGALFRDRADAGRRLAASLEGAELEDAVVVGLARGGVPVAAEIARRFSLPLDVVAVRKVGHPRQPEYALGAVTPGGDVNIRSADGLGEAELRGAIDRALAEAEALDRVLHVRHPALDLRGRTVVLVDDGLATGATMVTAVRWARWRGARLLVVAVPVGASDTVGTLRREADAVVCPHAQVNLGSVGFWYGDFTQVGDDDVLDLLDELSRAAAG